MDVPLSPSAFPRRIEDAKLFFPEEMPDMIAKEAKQLWNV
jgi:hypothetical protein